MITRNNRKFIHYKDRNYVDYTLNAAQQKFDYSILSGIDATEYQSRLVKLKKAKDLVRDPQLLLVSYTKVDTSDAGAQTIMNRESVQLAPDIHKFVFMEGGLASTVVGQFDFIEVPVKSERTILVDANDLPFEL